MVPVDTSLLAVELAFILFAYAGLESGAVEAGWLDEAACCGRRDLSYAAKAGVQLSTVAKSSRMSILCFIVINYNIVILALLYYSKHEFN
jgi:hypothetical protein